MSTYTLLLVFVEGNDDERFFSKIFAPSFKEKYDDVRLIKYASMKKEKITNFIKSIEKMGVDYIFLTDIDYFPCVTAKKEELQRIYKCVDIDKIVVVIKEIESWYLAGLDSEACKKLGIKNFNNTENIDKEGFNSLFYKYYSGKFSRIDFMTEILNNYSIETAKKKNRSLRYFVEKHLEK